jgi:predicted chitinase
MAFTYDVNKVIDKYLEKGGKVNFPDSLRQVLTWAKNDSRIYKREHLAYLLATAKAESGYSLQRWESDWLCGNVGMPYKDKPCQKVLDYYGSSSGKKNYYNLGIDKNGLPYFGRGLIQLTGKGNYETYGKLLGKNLVGNPELALEPKNSYDIAVLYMNKRKTFDNVDKGDFTEARRTVNGGTKGLNEVNDAYRFWMSVLKDSGIKEKKVVNTISKANKDSGGSLLIIGVGLFVVSGVFLSIYIAKKFNK